MREELLPRFACRVSRKLQCKHCHHDEIISEEIPYIQVRDFTRSISEELLGSTNSTCPTCSFVSPTDVTIESLGSHILVIINRVHQSHAKLNQHYNFPLRFQDKDLVAIGEHVGSNSEDGHWLRHELIGTQWVTVSDDTVAICSDIPQIQASFLVYAA